MRVRGIVHAGAAAAGCVACPEGTMPNAEGTGCISCSKGTEAVNGACVECARGRANAHEGRSCIDWCALYLAFSLASPTFMTLT